MKITDEKIRRITISEADGIDPIRVMLEDLGCGQGRINIECWGKSWANFWGGMGKDTIAQFFASCDEHYLAGKLSDIPSEEFDPDGLLRKARHRILFERKAGYISKKEARERYDDAEQLSAIDCEESAWANAGVIAEFFGEDWHCDMPTKPNPDYLYLCRIIKTVQAALKELNNG